MKNLFVAVSLMLGIAAWAGGCGGDGVVTDEEETGDSLEEVEQALCIPTCPQVGRVWTACYASTRCPVGGEQEERWVCVDGSDGGPVCRTRCCAVD